jgi:hypothetical protein
MRVCLRLITYVYRNYLLLPKRMLVSTRLHGYLIQFVKKKEKGKKEIDSSEIRTLVPEGTRLAGERLNHSAKLPMTW